MIGWREEIPIDCILDFWGDGEMISLWGTVLELFEDGVDFDKIMGIYFCQTRFESFNSLARDIMSCDASPSMIS
jgi:hypothetical protein